MSNKPDYIEMEWRIRCDGWWRKTIIGAVLILVVVGACSNFLKALGF